MKSYNDWIKDKEDSIRAINKNEHFIIEALGGGHIYSIEGSNDPMLQLLDKDCGIDYMWEKDKKVRGIATRVQWGIPYDTFTIRSKRQSGAETEGIKRLEAIGESFYPHLTMQMYCNNREESILESMAIIKTEDLYQLLVLYPELFHTNKSDNDFEFIRWRDIRNKSDKNILIKRRGRELEGQRLN